VIGALLIDERPAGLRQVCASLSADVLELGALLDFPEIGPLCGVFVPRRSYPLDAHVRRAWAA
jgi:hypothetical protein